MSDQHVCQKIGLLHEIIAVCPFVGGSLREARHQCHDEVEIIGVLDPYRLGEKTPGQRGALSDQRLKFPCVLEINLFREFIDTGGGDLRFSASGATICNQEDARPLVSYTDAGGSHEIACDYIVDCDGSRGVSRESISKGVLTEHSHEFGYVWLAALVESRGIGAMS